MFITTTGIVLHKIKYSETSVIVKVLTRAAGVQTFIIKGAYSKKNKAQLALLENLSIINITFEERNSEIQYWKEVSLHYAYQNIPFDMVRRSLLLFYNEFIYKILRDFNPDESLYAFIENALMELDNPEACLTDIHLHFMLNLSKQMGFFPTNNYSPSRKYFSIEDSEFITEYFDYPSILSLDASRYLIDLMEEKPIKPAAKAIRDELLHGLISYFILHNEQISQIESADILTEILG